MRAILVSVDYADLLRITLPYNIHHFEEAWVVTSKSDPETAKAVMEMQARQLPVSIFATDAFYDDGAVFNKWKALEQGLDAMGRHGWLVVMDADILWPKWLRQAEGTDGLTFYREIGEPVSNIVQPGQLCTPLRRMMTTLPPMCLKCSGTGMIDTTDANNKIWRTKTPCDCKQGMRLPAENEWSRFPLHPNGGEWAGYSQIFHASDPVLGPPPWHEVNWRHCGGADSFFQKRWSPERKVRPPWEVLHLGEAGVNWAGRATPYLDGTMPANADQKRQQVRNFIRSRRPGPPEVRFANEKLP